MSGPELTVIGGGGGISEFMWRSQLNNLPLPSCEPIYHDGTEIMNRPPEQHCSAEGYCR